MNSASKLSCSHFESTDQRNRSFKRVALESHTRIVVFACLTAALVLADHTTVTSQPTLEKGVNLTQWFQVPSARQIQFSKFTRTDLEQIRALGADVIRLPINLHAMTNGAPDYVIDPLFYTFMDQVVTWSNELGITLILDNHTFDPIEPTSPDVGDVLNKVWAQMAEHYKGRGVVYEVLNEPHGISAALWGQIQQRVIETIRAHDTETYIIVGGVNYNSYNDLATLPVYTDTKLIYTFHFYDPFLFTHQGASWSSPSLEPLSGMPFPYDASAMPGLPASLRYTWIESAYNAYSVEGTAARVKQLIDIAVSFSTQRGVQVYCGELGVFIPNSDNAQRVAWHKLVADYLKAKNIPWTIWDYQGGFGLFEKGSDERYDYDLNVPLLQALGFNVPPQKEPVREFQTTSFDIYNDYIGKGIINVSNSTDGTLDFYNADAHDGDFSIRLADVDQYYAIGLDFKPDLEMSLLPQNNFQLEFWVKGDTPGSSFDIRFVDSKASDEDHPWRMGITVDQTWATWDNNWHHVSIPLSSLQEKGSYDNGWFEAQGKFSWHDVDRLEIVAESQSLSGIAFQFDEIRVTGETVVVTAVHDVATVWAPVVSPNPSSGTIRVQYQTSRSGEVTFSVTDMVGRGAQWLQSYAASEGSHESTLTLEKLPRGLYLLTMESPDGRFVKKIVLE